MASNHGSTCGWVYETSSEFNARTTLTVNTNGEDKDKFVPVFLITHIINHFFFFFKQKNTKAK